MNIKKLSKCNKWVSNGYGKNDMREYNFCKKLTRSNNSHIKNDFCIKINKYHHLVS